MLRIEFQAHPAGFLAEYATTLPGSGRELGTITTTRVVRDEGTGRNRIELVAGSFYEVESGGRTIAKGYDFLPQPIQVAWYEYQPGELLLVVKDSQMHLEGPMNTGISQPLAIPEGEWFAAYFLPWQKGHVARMQLPIGGTTEHFFTAEMNGCAFLAAGRPASPLVAHLNVEEPEVGKPEPWVRHRQLELEKQIRETLRGKTDLDARLLTKWGEKIGGEGTERALLTNGPRYEATEEEAAGAIEGFSARLLAENRKIDPTAEEQAPIVDIRCSTMGFRDNGNWSFHYQRCLQVTATRTVTKLNSKWKGLKKKVLGDQRPREKREVRFPIPNSECVRLWRA